MNILRHIYATLLGFIAGATLSVFSTVFMLEALHTKDAFISLFVVVMALVAGCVVGLRLRRFLIGASASAENSSDDQP